MTEIFIAKTVEEAKRLAVEKFGKDINEINFEVIEEPKKGFLGMRAKNAKVKATYVEVINETLAESVPEVSTPVEQIVEKQEISEPVVEVPVEESNVSTTVEENVEKQEVSEPVIETSQNQQNVKEVSTEAPVETVEKNDDENSYSIENFTLI